MFAPRVFLALSLATAVVSAQTDDATTEDEPHGANPPNVPARTAPKAGETAASEAQSSEVGDESAAESKESEAEQAESTSSAAGESVPTAPAPPITEAPEPSEAPAPILAAPRATDQDPPPVFAPAEGPRDPNLELAVYAGAAWRTSSEADVEYGAGLAWGVSAGVYPLRFLAARGYARFAKIPVDVKPGGYDTDRTQYPDTSFVQDDLDVFGLGFRLEPGPRIGERVRIFAVLDASWTRFVAPAPKTRGAQSVESSERRGVGVDYKFGLGVSFEPIEDWMSVSADGTYGFITRQTGNAFDDVLQGIDASGSIVHMKSLPKFERSIEALLSIGLIL